MDLEVIRTNFEYTMSCQQKYCSIVIYLNRYTYVVI